MPVTNILVYLRRQRQAAFRRRAGGVLLGRAEPSAASAVAGLCAGGGVQLGSGYGWASDGDTGGGV